VHNVLNELNADKIPSVLAFNKIDLVKDPFLRKKLSLAYPQAIFISAFNKDDISALKECIANEIKCFEMEKQRSEIISKKTKKLSTSEQ
jgi:50S ribosomal subunit-associated GTPase HflX